jgi:hypothetical protein
VYPLFYRLQVSSDIAHDEVLDSLEFHFDWVYDWCCAPEIMQQFREEMRPPDPDDDPEGFANHRISSELAAQLKDIKRERNALKMQCFDARARLGSFVATLQDMCRQSTPDIAGLHTLIRGESRNSVSAMGHSKVHASLMMS